jgi:hypothetical protein
MKLATRTDDAPARTCAGAAPSDRMDGMSLTRIAWIVTVLACLVASLLLLVSGYQGYAAVTLAVGLSAAINLF